MKTIYWLLLVVCATGFRTEAQVEETPLKYHTLRFFLDPRLANNFEFTQYCLQKYMDDVNIVLAKNTVRRLEFNPETGIILTSDAPHTAYFGGGAFPTEGFEIWAYIRLAEAATRDSYGGNASFDHSGAGVLENLFWKEIYDPDNLGSQTVREDYFLQVGHFLHELAHVFGAGDGEYYNFAIIGDTTGTLPFMPSILANYPNDPYWWGSKSDYFADPLLGGGNLFAISLLFGEIRNRDEFLGILKYAPLTAAVMNGSYRGNELATLPDLDRIRIVTVNAMTGMPIPGVQVHIWNVNQAKRSESTLQFAAMTDQLGVAVFSWGDRMPFNNETGFKLIKTARRGFVPAGRYVSVFDLQEEKLLRGNAEATVVIPVAPHRGSGLRIIPSRPSAISAIPIP